MRRMKTEDTQMFLLICPAGSDDEMADADAAEAAEPDAAAEEASKTVGSGRQAAQGKKTYKDQAKLPKGKKSDHVKAEKGVSSEKDAWEQTKPEEGADSKTRR